MQVKRKNIMAKYRVLTVDDDLTTCSVIGFLFKNAPGWESETVFNGAEALEKLKNNDYDILLTDVYMPVMDGYHLIKELREKRIFIPVAVMTSANLEKELFVKFLNEGVQKYIEKPFNKKHIKELEEIIDMQREKDKTRYGKEKEQEAQNSLKRAVQSYKEITAVDLSIIKGIEIEYIFRPLSWLGGDFFAVNKDNNYTKIFIADIAGHDAGTSFYSVMLKMLFDEYFSLDDEDFLKMINKKLLLNTSFEKMCTALMVSIDNRNRQIRISNAGHPMPVFIRNNITQFIELTKCSMLGIFNDPIFKSILIELRKGDRFYFYTDGLLETSILDTKGIRKQLKPSDFLKHIKKNNSKNLTKSVENIYHEILKLSKYKQLDDIMLIGIEI